MFSNAYSTTSTLLYLVTADNGQWPNSVAACSPRLPTDKPHVRRRGHILLMHDRQCDHREQQFVCFYSIDHATILASPPPSTPYLLLLLRLTTISMDIAPAWLSCP